jgi:hypothetical protein
METAEGAALLQEAPQEATVAVVSLGYVNTRSEVARGHLGTAIDQVVAAAGPRRVVWVNLAATADCSRSYTQAVGVANGLLQQAQARWANLVLADFATLLADHPEYSEQRCPHLLPAGYQARADWLAGEVRRLVDEGQGSPRGG